LFIPIPKLELLPWRHGFWVRSVSAVPLAARLYLPAQYLLPQAIQVC
jgi:hypothetical protein